MRLVDAAETDLPDGLLAQSPLMHVLRVLVKAPSRDLRERAADHLARVLEEHRLLVASDAHQRLQQELQAFLLRRLWSSDQRARLGAIAAYAALTHDDGELYNDRVMRTSSALRVLDSPAVLAYADHATSRASVRLMRSLVDEPGVSISRLIGATLTSALVGVQDAYAPALKLDRVYLARMSRNCMVIEDLCEVYPSDATKDIDLTVGALCGLIGAHEDPIFRDHVVACLNKLLAVCATLADDERAAHLTTRAFNVLTPHFCRILSEYVPAPDAVPPAAAYAVSAAFVEMRCALDNTRLRSMILAAHARRHDWYARFCDFALAYRVCPSGDVQDTLADALSSLANAHPDRFQDSGTLHVAIHHLLARARTPKLRKPSLRPMPPGPVSSAGGGGAAASPPGGASFSGTPATGPGSSAASAAVPVFVSDEPVFLHRRERALAAAGQLAKCVGHERFKPFLQTALLVCGELLSESIRPESVPVPHTVHPHTALRFVTSIADACQVLDPTYAEHSKHLLGKMFLTGVSESLTRALKAHLRVVPSQERYVQNILIRKVEGLLSDSSEPTTSPVSPTAPTTPTPPTATATSNTALVTKGAPSAAQPARSDDPGESTPNAGSASTSAAIEVLRLPRPRPTGLPRRPSEQLFQSKSTSNVCVGYVSALGEHRGPKPALQSDVYSLDEDFLLELPSAKSCQAASDTANVKSPVVVALVALATFEFSALPPTRLAWFANQHVVRLLESSRVVVRRLSAQALTSLMKHAILGENGRLRSKTAMVLSQLVSVAIADPSRQVRLTVLEELSAERFERYLAQEDVMPHLALTIHDEDIEVRMLGVALVCELGKNSSSVGEPIIRDFLRHILTLLGLPRPQLAGSSVFFTMKTQACRLLGKMLQTADREFLKRFGESMFDALLVCLKEQMTVDGHVDIDAALPVLLAIGDVAGDLDVALDAHVKELLRLLVAAVLDVDSSACDTEFRVAALRALARVVQNTALAVKPYDLDQRLLGSLMSSLKSESNDSLRCEILALLGAMGAVNPDRDGMKYVSLPSTQAVNSVRGAFGYGAPMTFGTGSGLGLPGSGGARNNSPVSGAEGVSPQSSGKEGSAGAKPPRAPLLTGPARLVGISRKPDPIQNAAMSVDFKWLSEVFDGKIAVWQQSKLRTDSLVSRLEHPYTVSPLYFPSVVLDFLHKIVGQAKHAALHVDAVESLVLLVSVMKKSSTCSGFLPYIMPRLLWMLQPVEDTQSRSPVARQLERLFGHFLDLVKIVKQDIAPHMPDTVALCYSYLCQEDALFLESAIAFVTELLQLLRKEMGDSMRPYALYVMGPLISSLVRDRSPDRSIARWCIETIQVFGELYAGYMSVIAPALVFVFEDPDAPLEVRELAISTLASSVGNTGYLGDLLSCVLHPLIRLIGTIPSDDSCDGANFQQQLVSGSRLATKAARAVRAFALHAPEEFITYAPIVAKAVTQGNLNRAHSHCKGLEAVLLSSIEDVALTILGYEATDCSPSELSSQLEDEFQLYTRMTERATPHVNVPDAGPASSPGDFVGMHQADSTALLRAFEVHEKYSAKEWNQWMDNLCSQLLRHSASAAMRTVANLGERYPRLVRDLFNAAFLSYWPHRSEREADPDEGQMHQLVHVFERAFSSKSIPLNVKQSLLDLVEYMDHGERPIPINPELLARAAVEVGAFAKALRHREAEYVLTTMELIDPEVDRLQPVVADASTGLVEIYTQLGHRVSAVGILEDFKSFVGEITAKHVNQQYYESLDLCSEALDVYRDASENVMTDVDLSTVNATSFERGKQLFLSGFTGKSSDLPEDLSHALEPSRRHGGDVITKNVLAKYHIGDEDFNAMKADRDMKWFLTLSELRVLNRLGQWHEMESKVDEVWGIVSGNSDARSSLAIEGRAASVAFDLSKWPEFTERVSFIEDGSWSKEFYLSLVCVQKSHAMRDLFNLGEAERHIMAARQLLDTGFTSRAAEGYPRAYDDFLNAQHLVEMEEMVSCLRHGKTNAGMRRLKCLWDARQEDAKPDQHTWYRLLMIRSLLLTPLENKAHWLTFAAKCRKENRLPMATEALRKLVKHAYDVTNFLSEDQRGRVSRMLEDESGRFPPVSAWSPESLVAIPDTSIMFACTKLLWTMKYKVSAVDTLRQFVASHGSMQRMTLDPVRLVSTVDNAVGNNDDGRLFSDIYLKLAKWTDILLTTSPDERLVSEEDSLRYAWKATQWNSKGYKPWHFWASLNARLAADVVRSLEDHQTASRGQHGVLSEREERLYGLRDRSSRPTFNLDDRPPPIDNIARGYIKEAIRGYFSAIDVAGENGLEDVLTLLTLWFRYGSYPDLDRVFSAGFERSSPDSWLPVVPQIIARLHSQHAPVRVGIEKLLLRIGVAHPQVAVYPLTVAATTPGDSSTQVSRRARAHKILRALEERHKAIVTQAKTVAYELNRVAILDLERWYDGIEEASRLFYGDRNPLGMVETLRALYKSTIMKEPETKCEQMFRAAYKRELARAHRLGEVYLELEEARRNVIASEGESHPSLVKIDEDQREALDKAWEVYCDIFRRMQRQQIALNTLVLSEVSPKLDEAEDMVLVIPGTYAPGDANPVRIQRFTQRLDVMQSKQHPRKLQILGTDGKTYDFLLKGHDDLRQDERVMQVFRLMNLHLSQCEDREVRRVAHLQLYSIIVLSSTAGLIQWVSNSDTMHALVKGFREKRQQIPNIEHKVMLRTAIELERLPLLQKVDVFETMLNNTGGRDIGRILWLRSRNSEMWLDRRTNFARTLATTSMAGYILGLGDRHPSNIMIGRDTGKIMHIDFGDCFEVAMRREKYPEKVPFRLTRMLVLALEPCGVRGHFRHMAIAFMRVLRLENVKAALLAMMEAFVFDPLIRQKLLDGDELLQGNEDAGGHARQESQSHLAQQYRRAGSLAGALRLGSAGIDVNDGLIALGPTPSQRSRSIRERAIGRDGESMSKRFAALALDRASEAIIRVDEKLSGLDFEDVDPSNPLTVEEQIDRLVEEAQNIEHLCQLFSGWVPSW